MNTNRLSRIAGVLRIASTLFFGLLCFAFTVFWIRSYQFFDGGMISTLPNQHVAFSSGIGRMCVWFEHSPANQWGSWHSRRNDSIEPLKPEDRIPIFDLAFFWPKMTRLYVAHWFLAVAAAIFAFLPWCPRKFSILGLLIALTVVAAIAATITWIDSTFW